MNFCKISFILAKTPNSCQIHWWPSSIVFHFLCRCSYIWVRFAVTYFYLLLTDCQLKRKRVNLPHHNSCWTESEFAVQNACWQQIFESFATGLFTITTPISSHFWFIYSFYVPLFPMRFCDNSLKIRVQTFLFAFHHNSNWITTPIFPFPLFHGKKNHSFLHISGKSEGFIRALCTFHICILTDSLTLRLLFLEITIFLIPFFCPSYHLVCHATFVSQQICCLFLH